MVGVALRRWRLGWIVACLIPFAIGVGLEHDGAAAPADGKAYMADLARRWQGVWIVRDAAYPGSIEAWEVTRDHLTAYDAKKDRVEKERFTLLSPCRLERTRFLEGGRQSVVTTDTFVFAGDGLHVARAPAAGGLQMGPVVTACIGEHVYTFDPRTGNCLRSPARAPDRRLAEPALCAITKDVTRSFVVRPAEGGHSVSLPFYGKALLSDSLVAHVAEPRPSFKGAVRHAAALAR